MKRLVWALLLASLAGCAGSTGDVGTVDLARIQANWPKFLNYQNQIYADEEAIERSPASDATKAREQADLRARYARLQAEITSDVTTAAAKVAAARHLELIVTREFVGYGGIDVTADVEQQLHIVEAKVPPT